MRICIIAEGSYPYITGGVSSWINTLISNMPEHEFIIYTICSHEKQRGVFKYNLPSNVIQVMETFLDTYLREDGEWGRNLKLDNIQRQAVRSLLGGKGEGNWSGIFSMLRSKRFKVAADFLMSKDYFDILTELCEEKYILVPFTEMFWTVRSMILPLFLTIRNDIPEADLYHSVSTGYAGVIGSLAKHLYNKPFIITEHGIYSREREEEIIKADWVKGYFKDLWIHYFYQLSACSYNFADEVITLYNRNREIEIELGCDSNKIKIIPNGVSLHEYASIIQEVNADEVFRIGAIVRVVPIKDIKTMIQSFAIVKRELPHAELYIMGPTGEDEEYFEECKQLVETLQIQDIIFTGEVRVKEYLGRMDLMVLTSVSEGQPLAILEGMACGKAFVTTDVGSCRELLFGRDDDIGPAGIIVQVLHYEQLGKAIVRLGKDQALREEMGWNGLKRVELYYTRDKFIESYRACYNSYVGGDDRWQE